MPSSVGEREAVSLEEGGGQESHTVPQPRAILSPPPGSGKPLLQLFCVFFLFLLRPWHAEAEVPWPGIKSTPQQ